MAFSSPTMASREPMVSALRITPSASASILTASSSDFSSRERASASSGLVTTLMVEPARALSSLGADTLTPDAAATCFTGRNLSSLRISARGLGLSNALILVMMGS